MSDKFIYIDMPITSIKNHNDEKLIITFEVDNTIIKKFGNEGFAITHLHHTSHLQEVISKLEKEIEISMGL